MVGPFRQNRQILGVVALVLLAAACGPQQEVVDAYARGTGVAATSGAAAGTTATAPPEGTTGGPGTTGFPGGGTTTTTGGSTGLGSTGVSGATAGSGSTGAASGAAGSASTGALLPAAGGNRTGVSATEVRLGFHVPKHVSGVDFDKIAKISELIRVYWTYVNEVGDVGQKGVNGRQVRIRVEDDFYDPTASIAACRTLADDFKAFFISGTGGADQTVACGQYLSKRKIYYGSLGASENGLDKTPYYFAFSATYDDQAPLQARWIVNTLGGKTKSVALIRANSANFDGAHRNFVAAFRAAAKKNLAVDDVVDRNGDAQELATECTKLAAANDGKGVDIVSVLASPTVFSRLAQACQAQGYEPQYTGWANTAACNPDPAALGTPALDGCLTFSIYHSPYSVPTRLGKLCRDAWNAYATDDYGAYPVGAENICGYMDLLREGLRRAGRDLTRERLAAILRAMRYDNGLLNPIDFRGGQFGSDKVVIWRANASCTCVQEPDRRWRNSF